MAKKIRKYIRVRADEVEAGDRIVVMHGSIRKAHHVCEVHEADGKVHIVYNTVGGFGHIHKRVHEKVRVRS